MNDLKLVLNTPLVRGEPFSFRALTDAYMVAYRGRDRDQINRLLFFVERLGDRLASEIDADAIEDCLTALQRRGKLMNRGGQRRGGTIVPTYRPLANATINRYRCSIQAALTWARKKRLMPKGWTNPVNETQRLPEDNMRTRYLKPHEYEALIKMCRISQWEKLTALVMVAVTTGARRGTLMGLRWADVDLERGEAYVQRTKNGEPFVLVLLPDVINELKRLPHQHDKDALVFCGRNPYRAANFEKSWETALRNAKLDGSDVVFHTLRHTHASWLARQGAPLLAIADSMGHKSLAMTKRYAHLCVDSRKEMIHKTFLSG
jgi:integrase